MFSDSNAQTKSLDPKQELLNLLKSKHDFERVSYYNEENAIPLNTKYQESFAKLKKNKHKIITYIDKALKVDSQALAREFVLYDYKSPASSEPLILMSFLTYYKIIKYSLAISRSALPQLSEIPTL